MALRFNGQSPTTTTGAYSAFPGRVVGTVSGIAVQTSMAPLFLARRNQQAAFGPLSGQPDGTLHPISFLMPSQGGRVSSRSARVTISTSGVGVLGLPTAGSTSIQFTVASANLELVVSAIGSADINFTASGSLAGALAAVGSSDITFGVPAATLGAVIDALGAAQFAFTGSATPRAVGVLAGNITPFTELSPQNLADAVLLAAQNQPIHANIQQVNSIAVDGAGTEADPFGPA